VRPSVPALAFVVLAAASSAYEPRQGVLGGPVGGTPSIPLSPVDDAAAREDFFVFRARLQAALARRDLDAVLAVVAPDIKNSFGGDDGRDGFLRMWTPREPESRLWEELATVLALGGTFDSEDRFVAPYVFSRWPAGVDPFEHVTLVGKEVRMLAAPRADADVVGTGSFVIVRLARNAAAQDVPGWTAVRNGDQTAYVPESLVRSPVGYRAFFERRDDRWQLVIFVAGD
jgi:hypothetical protein